MADFIVKEGIMWTPSSLPEACSDLLMSREKFLDDEVAGLEWASKRGDLDLMKFLIKEGKLSGEIVTKYLSWGMDIAISNRDNALMEEFLKTGAKFWCGSISCAVAVGNDSLVERIISGENVVVGDWKNDYFRGAVKGERLDIIEAKTENLEPWMLKDALCGAAVYGHKELIDYFIYQGIGNWENVTMSAIHSGQLAIVEFIFDKELKWREQNPDLSSVPWIDWCMRTAVSCEVLEIVEFFIDKGACNWEEYLSCAIYENNLALIDFFLDKCQPISKYKSIMSAAAGSGSMKLIEFFIDSEDINWRWCMDAVLLLSGNKKMVEFIIKNGDLEDLEYYIKCVIDAGYGKLKEYLESIQGDSHSS